MEHYFFGAQSILIALAVGMASASIGTFIILKRMALVGDALSHVALPGIALAIFYGIDPFWGVLIFLIGASVVIWFLEAQTELAPDAVVGFLFTASLAIGILTIPNTEILESLFGAFPRLGFAMFGASMLFAIGVAALAFFLARRFTFWMISEDLARVEGISRIYNLILLLALGCAVALGIKLVGTLLMGALTVIPAAIAKNASRSMRGYLVSALLMGGGISVGGVVLAERLAMAPGPIIILLGVALFGLSFLAVRR